MIRDPQVYDGQFGFQRRYAIGRALNVGSNSDGAQFGRRGGINVDLFAVDPVTGVRNPVQLLADARALPFPLASFDSVVLGELLEHMEGEAAIQTLLEARRTSKCRVVITMPHDDRRDKGTEPPIEPGKEMYAPGVFAYHHRCISREELLGWVRAVGLIPLVWARIVYVWGAEGTGLVTSPW